MKRVISVVLVAILIIGMIPVTAFAASSSYIEVTKDNAPLRVKGDGDATIVFRCAKGTVLETVGTYFNLKKLSDWFEVKIPGEKDTYFIFTGNAEYHKHKATEMKVNGIIYKICTCGDISANVTTKGQKDEANVVLSSTSLALPLAAADGPLPFGELAAVSILVLGVCFAHDYAVPTVEDLAEMISEADFDKYLKERENNTCSIYSFRRVVRYPGGLKYLDQYCMDAVEAYVYVRLLQGDVYTSSEDSALILAAMFGSAIMERDKPAPSKDITTFYFHYHVGTNRGNKAHIFFGLNDLGQAPT